MLLVLQTVVPAVIAGTLFKGAELSFVQLEMDPSSEKETVKLHLGLEANIKDETERTFMVSKNFIMIETERKDLINKEGVVQGSYQVKKNQIEFRILASIEGEITIDVSGSISEDNQEEQLKVTLGEETKIINLPKEWQIIPESDNSSSVDSSSESRESPGTEEIVTPSEEVKISNTLEGNQADIQNTRANQDIKDIYQSLNKEDTFLETMILTFTDKDGNLVNDPKVEDTIHFAFTFILDEDVRQLLQGGDFFSFQLPNTVKINQKQVYALSDNDGIHYADVTINLDGSVVLTFTNEVGNASEIKGEFHFTGTFDKSNIPNPRVITIIPGTYEALKVTIQLKPNYAGNSIEKGGHFNRVQNPSQIIWNVDINKGLNLIENIQVKEEFPLGTIFDSVMIYQVQVDFDGKVIGGSETSIDPSKYNVDTMGNITFNEPTQAAYRLVYTTIINEDAKPGSGGVVDFTNKAVLSTKNTADASTEATVSAKYGKELEKSRGNYDTTTQRIDWKIAYNYGEKIISNGSLTDTFQNNLMILVPNSIRIFELSFTNNGTPVRGRQLAENTDYQVVPVAHGFTLNFLSTVQTALDIRYQTGYDGVIETTVPLKNEVVTSSGQTDSSKGTYTQQNVIKRLGRVDYSKQTIEWSIDINRNKYMMSNWTLTDTASPGLSMKLETFKIYDNDTNQFLVKDVDYTFNYDETNRITSLSFINNYIQTDHSFKISYTDNYDTESDVSPDLKYTNKAHVTWVTPEGKTIDSENQQSFYPNESTRYNGAKSGMYNAVSKIITWSVAINYRDKDLENGKIVDPIQSGQNFIRNSIKIYRYTTGTDGSIIKGNELTEAEYLTMGIQQPSVGNNQVLIINFPNNQSENYLVEFQTSLDNEQVHAKYKNDAVFSNDNYQDYKLHAEVSVAHGDEFLTKKGTQDSEGYVHWDVTINGSQSTLYDLSIEDIPSANQAIDLSSLHLFNTSVNETGLISPDLTKELVQGRDYSVDLTTDNSTGEQKLKIHLQGDYIQLERPLIMNYRTMVFLESSQGTVTNEIKMKSTGKTQIETGIASQLNVIVSEGGGSASGTRGKITIKKIGENGAALPKGAIFELLDKNKQQVLRSGEVDQNGLITFGTLTYGTYILREKDTLTEDGYTIDQTLVDGINVVINSTTTQGTPLVIQNSLGKVQLTKESESGQKLQGAEFMLEAYDILTSSWVNKIVNQGLKTNYDGTLIIKGLSPGKYRLIEIKAPSNYILNTVPVEFEVATNEHNQLVQVGMSDAYINYQASLRFIKKNSLGIALQGSVFELFKSGDTVESIATVVSDQQGQVSFENVGPGDYVIKEKQSSEGYMLNTETLEVNVPEQTNQPVGTIDLGKDFINYQGTIEVTKIGVSSDRKNSLKGVQFNLENDQEQVIQSGITDNEGKWVVENLAPGTYYIVETSVGINTDYILNSEKVKVVIDSSTHGKPKTITIEQNNYQGDVQLKKVDSQGNPLEGAEFTIYKQGDSSVIQTKVTSDKEGIIKAVDLAPGLYYLKETKAPIDPITGEEYIINEFPILFEIKSEIKGKPATVDLKEFQNFKGKVNLTKVGKGDLAIAGAKFALYEAVGSNEVLVREIEVDADGTIDIENLSPGAYKLVEVEAPTGYVKNLQPIYFTIQEGEEGLPPVENLSIINYERGIKFSKISDKVQLVSEKLAKARFEIQDSQGNVVQVYDELNTIVSSFDTNEFGEVEVTGLKAGDYKLVETKAPEGYILNTESTPFTIDEVAGEPQHIILDLGTVVNYQGSIKIMKKNSIGENLSGGKFELRNIAGEAVEVTVEYGLKTTQLTAVDGLISASGIEPGNYHLVEVEAPLGYIREENSEVLPVVINSEGDGLKGSIFMGEFINYQGSVLLNKIDVETKKALSNAKFSLYTKNNDFVEKELSTNDLGKITVTSLAPGDYYFIETEAPKGYERSKEKYPFSIEQSSMGKPMEKLITVTNSARKINKAVVYTPPTMKKENEFGSFGERPEYGLMIIGLLAISSFVTHALWRKKKMR